MAKSTSLSDPSIPIGPALHVVRLSGRCFSQTLVWPAHAVRVSGGAASIANVGILPQKTRLRIQRVDGGTLWSAK